MEHKEAYLSSAGGLKRDDEMMNFTKGEIADMKHQTGQIVTSGQ